MLSQILSNNNFKKILVCPLDWGLGHASRLIIVIEKLLEHNFEVVIAADKSPLALLQKEFPTLKFIILKGAEVKYSNSKNQIGSILKFLPSFVQSIKQEHLELNNILKENHFDVVISDNRYGLWNKNSYTVLITHQLKLKLPFFLAFAEGFTKLLIYNLVKSFDEIWVPDFEDSENNLSGKLSHFRTKLGSKLKYIGILSKFQSSSFTGKENRKTLVLSYISIILSGPEPQRTLLEELLLSELSKTDLNVKFILGKQEYLPKTQHYTNIEFIPFAGKEELYEVIQNSEFVICRAGYSSIMDLVVLNKKAILIPTPGQTEQEYLAEYLKGNKLFYSITQDEFSIERLLEIIEKGKKKRKV